MTEAARPPIRRSPGRPRAWLLTAALALATAPTLAAQTEKPDHVSYVNRRGNVTTLTGRVIRNSLDGVQVEIGRDQRELDPSAVQRIVYGQTPAAFRDGMGYFDRGDHANAAASYRLAAADPIARPPVQAEARLRAARSELLLGATDPSAFARALEEAQRFLLDFPTNRGVPEARALEARAARLSGDAAVAGESYRAIYKELEAGTPGYAPLLCFRSGIHAAEAFIAAGKVDEARALFSDVEATVPRALGSLDEGDPERAGLLAVQAQARLGDGFCQLASGSTGAAHTFFEGQLRDAEGDTALRHGARLGLAEALLAQDKAREAQIAFAQVSALDHTDRDRVGRALIGLAECALRLNDKNARLQAQRWVETVQERYGDTPAVLKAQELAKVL